MTISFTTGQALAALIVSFVALSLARCAWQDFESKAGRLFGLGGAVGITVYLIRTIPWQTL